MSNPDIIVRPEFMSEAVTLANGDMTACALMIAASEAIRIDLAEDRLIDVPPQLSDILDHIKQPGSNETNETV